MSETTIPQTRTFDGLEIPAPGTFVLDASHSHVGFVARHLVVSKARGRFGAFDGVLTLADDPLESSVEVTVDLASIDTRDEQRDEHLRGADFFDVENHSTMSFRSTAVRPSGKRRFAVDGELTSRGVTNPITLAVELDGVTRDPWGNERIAFSAEAEVDREAWGLTWNVALETGGVLVGKKVKLEIEAQAIRQ